MISKQKVLQRLAEHFDELINGQGAEAIKVLTMTKVESRVQGNTPVKEEKDPGQIETWR